jgi:hypothetical protein
MTGFVAVGTVWLTFLLLMQSRHMSGFAQFVWHLDQLIRLFCGDDNIRNFFFISRIPKMKITLLIPI